MRVANIFPPIKITSFYLRNLLSHNRVYVEDVLGYYISIILSKYKEFFIRNPISSNFSKSLALHSVKNLIKSSFSGLYVQNENIWIFSINRSLSLLEN